MSKNLITKIENMYVHDTSAIHEITPDASSYTVTYGDPNSVYSNTSVISLPTDLESMLINLSPNLILRDTSDADISIYSKIECDGIFIKEPGNGHPGQVLTKTFNNENEWTYPSISGMEYVTVELDIESGEGSSQNVSVYVDVEGQGQQVLVTDSSGICNFSVAGGTMYSIAGGNIAGYATPASVSYRSILSVRNVSMLYKTKASVEHVTVLLNYDLSSTERATSLSVTTGGVTSQYNITDNVCEFDVSMGATYVVSFQDVSTYSKPANIEVVASSAERTIKVCYVRIITSMCWYKYDGTTIAFNNVQSTDYADIFGLMMMPSNLVTNNATYVIPKEYLFGDIVLGTKAWCVNAVQFTGIGMYGSESAAITRSATENNLDGEANTTIVIAEAVAEARGNVPAFTSCRNVSYTVGGVVKYGFLGSLAQVKAFSANRDTINSVSTSIFGKTCININSGHWWSSTQYSATNSWFLNNGSADYSYYYGKTYNFSVVPFFAI